MVVRKYSLDDKYTLEAGVAYMSGIQTLVRLPIEQMQRDRRQGLKTGAYISGYEGSPLGGYDIALNRVAGLLKQHNIHFQPGVNEDLAATAVMGAMIHSIMPGPNVDGVVGIWYGKGPGVDRSGDAFRHANLAGTGPNCGTLALCGDDHISKSSTIPHQSELSLHNFGMPVLVAGSTQEVLDFGLYGIALSRFCGSWTGFKLATDVCDGGATVEVSPERCSIVNPEFLVDGEPYRKIFEPLLMAPDTLQLEHEVLHTRLEAARLFAYENKLNQITTRSDNDRIGIVSAGKAYYDLVTAFRNVGLDEAGLKRAGIRVLKLGMTYPLEPRIIGEFIDGLDEVVVVEEKRSFIETQLREMLYNRNPRPAIHGKTGREGEPLIPSTGELDPELITRLLAGWIGGAPGYDGRIAELEVIAARFDQTAISDATRRTPSYCSGCPHNRSTLVLEGQIAGGGIGCHGMAALLEGANRGIAYIGHMGSEGAHWVGMSPFIDHKHLFQNLGEGTYFHSGRQGLNAAVASGVNVTFKILYNDAVAMTGGQTAQGAIGIPALTRELEAVGVKRIVVVAEDPTRYEDVTDLAELAELRPREDLEDTLRELEKVEGCTVMIYDQMCAAEKRRRRSRGRLAQPVRKLMINERVCEGCGDCIKKANCVSLRPVDTEYGVKTRIHQSSCNADYTCAMGDCPSFVSVTVDQDTGLKRRPLPDLPEAAVPEPDRVAIDGEYHILMPGVGGTGVVTMNAVLATAGLIDGLQAVTLDQTGLAQKGGAVLSHLTLTREAAESSNKVGLGACDLLLGFDVMGAASATNLRMASDSRTVAVVNLHEIPTGDAIRKGLTIISTEEHYKRTIERFTKPGGNIFTDASHIAETLFGGHVFANIFLTGMAYQAGLIPISAEAIEQAIERNGIAVERNLQAFGWGRQYAEDPSIIERYLSNDVTDTKPRTLDELITARVADLTAYQNAGYAERYRSFVERVRQADERLAEAVGRNLYKLMAYKDEYEVARLQTDPAFFAQIDETFEAARTVSYHFHPPLLRAMGLKNKLTLGAWFKPVLKTLSAFKFLRETPLDVFGYAKVRREERALIDWYRETVESLLPGLNPSSLEVALEIANAPDQIRGYENIKLESAKQAREYVAGRLGAASRKAAA